MTSPGTTLRTLRERKPLVHNITNYVVMNETANALLALKRHAEALAHVWRALGTEHSGEIEPEGILPRPGLEHGAR